MPELWQSRSSDEVADPYAFLAFRRAFPGPYMANGGYDQTQTYTGWQLKDNGSGNQWQVLSGFTYNLGSTFQVAPNFMWQKPIVGPIPAGAPAPARPRNILDDPFSVRVNRETIAGEILFTWDPTPATWMYAWDSDATPPPRGRP